MRKRKSGEVKKMKGGDEEEGRMSRPSPPPPPPPLGSMSSRRSLASRALSSPRWCIVALLRCVRPIYSIQPHSIRMLLLKRVERSQDITSYLKIVHQLYQFNGT